MYAHILQDKSQTQTIIRIPGSKNRWPLKIRTDAAQITDYPRRNPGSPTESRFYIFYSSFLIAIKAAIRFTYSC